MHDVTLPTMCIVYRPNIYRQYCIAFTFDAFKSLFTARFRGAIKFQQGVQTWDSRAAWPARPSASPTPPDPAA